jgi:hypothetical protein
MDNFYQIDYGLGFSKYLSISQLRYLDINFCDKACTIIIHDDGIGFVFFKDSFVPIIYVQTPLRHFVLAKKATSVPRRPF